MIRFAPHRTSRFAYATALAFLASVAGGCGCGPQTAGPPPTPTPRETQNVPEGYHGLAWGTPRDRIAGLHSDCHPGKRDPKILVCETTVNNDPATEAFFFDAQNGLIAVEVRFTPKRTPAESAEIGRSMDRAMGAHEVPLADDNVYQFAWAGDETDVHLTYDVRPEVAFGPVIAWSKRGAEPVATPSGAAVKPTPVDSAAASSAGSCFAGAVKQARSDGLHLTAVEGGKGKLTLVYESAGGAREITLAADPKTSALLGCATLPRAAVHAQVQLRAEGAIDTEFARGIPNGLKFGGPAGLSDLVTIQFKDGKYISLRPGSPEALVSASANAPK